MYGYALSIVTFYITLHQVTCEFFHLPSAVLLKPGNETEPSDFGFSLGYFNKSLIVGDPRRTRWGFGEIYTCSLDLSNDTHCSNIQIQQDKTKNYTKVLNDHQSFYLGATIATMEGYILTCAPLATIYYAQKKGASEDFIDAVGSCFISYDGSNASYINNSPVERYLLHSSEKNKDKITGGIGWNSLADHVNGFFLVAKTSVDGDINYWDNKTIGTVNHPVEHESESALDNVKTKKKFNEAWDIGYGLAAGNFFSNKTVYAVSMQTKRDMKGQIVFLEPVNGKLQLLNINKRMICQINNLIVNTMFGYALGSADINQDGYSELLIGAPTQSNGDIESGAIYVYLGADITKITCYDRKRMRSIIAEKPLGRFGTSIAAADIDGDSVAEVFVSAPYEDLGVIYILSGFELRSTLLRPGQLQPLYLSELKLTQRIHRQGLSLFGFSMLVLPDVDGNGCSDLAIGAPDASSVVLLRSLQAVNVTISLQIVGSQLVKEEDKNFMVGVCIHASYNPKSANVSGHIIIKNNIDDPGVHIPQPNFDVYLSKNMTEYCNNVTVNLKTYGSGDYKFVTNLQLEKVEDTKEFNTAWAVLSPYSETRKSLIIPRHCKDEDCNPKLSMHLHTSITEKEYQLGTTKTESVTVVVENSGHVAYSACVRLQVQGAIIQRLDCDSEDEKRYRCLLVEPLKHSASRSIIIQLDMQTSRTNLDKELQVEAELYVNCDQKNINNTKDQLLIPYNISSDHKNIQLNVKDPHPFLVTDTQLLSDENDDLKLNQEPLKDSLEFVIKNDGPIIWNSIPANIFVEKSSFVEKVNTTEPSCSPTKDVGTHYKISCLLTLQPSNTKEISVLIHFLREELGKLNLAKGGKNITSEFVLTLTPTNETKTARFVSEIKLTLERSFRNNKQLIYLLAILFSLLILIIITIVMIKYGFFKRKQKQRLDTLRESFRKRSVRQDSDRRQSQKVSMAGGSGLPDVEEVEDCVFGEVSLTPPIEDDVMLVNAEAQVHTEKSI